jgi:hypothetical protein
LSESPGPPVIWPRLATAWTPSQNAGARGAPITNVVATTTGRDANKSRRTRATVPHSADNPEPPTTPMRQNTESSTPAVLTIWFAGTRSRPTRSSARPSAAEGPLQRSSRRARPRDWKRGEPVVRRPTEAIARRPRAVPLAHRPGPCSRSPARGETAECVAERGSRRRRSGRFSDSSFSTGRSDSWRAFATPARAVLSLRPATVALRLFTSGSGGVRCSVSIQRTGGRAQRPNTDTRTLRQASCSPEVMLANRVERPRPVDCGWFAR